MKGTITHTMISEKIQMLTQHNQYTHKANRIYHLLQGKKQIIAVEAQM